MSTQKTLELLELPDSFAKYEGQIHQKITRYMVIEETLDFTFSPMKKSVRTYIGSTIQNFGAYAFNLLSNYVKSYGYHVVDDNTLFKPMSHVMTTIGSFTGSEYWHGPSVAELVETTDGFDFDVHECPYRNTTDQGYPNEFVNAPVSTGKLYKVQISKTKSPSGVKTFVGARKVAKMNRPEFELLTGLSYEAFSEQCRTTFKIYKVNPETHITSLAMDIEQIGSRFEGMPYFNGISIEQRNPKGMITSFGQMWSGYEFQWRLYNDAGNTSLGTSALAVFQSNEINLISIVAGSVDKYDPSTKTLTYNESNPSNALVVAYMEAKPAQGKNENVGQSFYPEIGLETTWG